MSCRQVVLPLLLACVAAWSAAPAHAEKAKAPKWGSSLDKALKEAERTRRPVLVYVFDDV